MKTLRYYFALLLSLGLALGPVSTAHAGLESATYISDLNSSNPTAGDPVSQGDDHTRLIKSAVKATFPNISGAVTPTHTELNYVDGVTSAIQTQLDQAKLVNGTYTATTSGTAWDFTSIPSWAKRVTISLNGVSLSGTANLIFQLGDSGGVETSSYLGSGSTITGATTSSSNFTAGCGLNLSGAAIVVYGTITFTLVDTSSNTWIGHGVFSRSDAASNSVVACTKSLSATLDRVRATTSNGTDTGDAGAINIQYD